MDGIDRVTMRVDGDREVDITEAMKRRMGDHDPVTGEVRKGKSAAENALRAYVERIEALKEDQKALGEDITEVFAEAKANGYDVKAMKELIRLRAMGHEARAEIAAIVGLYARATGDDFDATPLGAYLREAG